MLLYKDILHSFLTKVRVGQPLANELLQEVVSNLKKKINNGMLGIAKKHFPTAIKIISKNSLVTIGK